MTRASLKSYPAFFLILFGLWGSAFGDARWGLRGVQQEAAEPQAERDDDPKPESRSRHLVDFMRGAVRQAGGDAVAVAVEVKMRPL
jgi:hypothetical protein